MTWQWRFASRRPGRNRLGPTSLFLTLLLVVPCILAGCDFHGPGFRRVAADTSVEGMPAGTTNTQFGPLAPADRDFLVKVRQAGLWEGPAGQLAQFRSASALVRDAGIHLVSGHAELDAKVLAVGATLGVELPNTASAAQRGWVQEMRDAATPEQFDKVFADRLRAAHGKVYALVSHIRTGTRNDLIRSFSARTMEVVLDHILALERTGAVDFDQLPLPVQPAIPADGQPMLVETASGPLTPASRELMVKMRSAALWEAPTGRQAQERAASTQVKEVGRRLVAGYAELDAKVEALSRKFGFPLPTEPSARHQAWMAELTAATPQEYDRIFVDRLRLAQSGMFTMLADVRAGTRNAEIRGFVQRAMTIVSEHMAVLERTGMVNFAALPLPPDPGPAAAPGGPGRRIERYLVVGMVVLTLLVIVAARRELRRFGE